MNSSGAAWLNLALAVIAAVLPILTTAPGLPSWVAAAALGANAILHAVLPDAPGGISKGK